MSRQMICVGLAVFTATWTPAIADDNRGAPAVAFEVVAYLKLGKEHRYKGDRPRAFSSVVMRMPWAYVLDRDGDLFVFKVPKAAPPEGFSGPTKGDDGHILIVGDIKGALIDPVRVVENVGDGGHLAMIGQTLLCSRQGGLETFSVAVPDAPRHLLKCRPTYKRGQATTTIAHSPGRAALIGWGEVALYDTLAADAPKHLGSFACGRDLRCGCFIGERLYAGTSRSGKISRNSYRLSGDPGIAVLDVQDPAHIQEVAFVRLKIWNAGELFPLPSGNILAAAGFKVAAAGFGRAPRTPPSPELGMAELLMPAKDGRFESIYEQRKVAGRSSSLLSARGHVFLVSAGVVHEVLPDRLNLCFQYAPWGLSTMEDAPYHGDADGDYVAIVGDRAVAVLRIKDRK